MSWLDAADFWHWWILAIVLGAIEMLVPGTYLMWLGAAAAVVGVALLVWPDMGWQGQLAIFAVLAVAFVLFARHWLRRHPVESDRPHLNRRGEQYLGRVFVLDEPVVNGSGRLRIDDSTWRVAGPDLAAGARVRIAGSDGTVLRVEAAD